MKQIIVLLVCVFLLTGVIGCHRPSNNPAVNSGVVLPASIAGTWKAYDSPWQIAISPDGKINSVVVPMGEVEVKPNQTIKVEMADGQVSIYKAGDCIVQYMPDTRELFVSIEMKNIHIAFLENALDGTSIDRFVGPVSKDGKVWQADWINVFDYGPLFPQGPNDIYAGLLIFEKVDASAPK